jgi:hypothetical protein
MSVLENAKERPRAWSSVVFMAPWSTLGRLLTQTVPQAVLGLRGRLVRSLSPFREISRLFVFSRLWPSWKGPGAAHGQGDAPQEGGMGPRKGHVTTVSRLERTVACLASKFGPCKGGKFGCSAASCPCYSFIPNFLLSPLFFHTQLPS